ncbi:MAG: hypothetical protein AVDCRST_MAG08-3181, partial [uncultured Acetobacteraceae bacterium]
DGRRPLRAPGRAAGVLLREPARGGFGRDRARHPLLRGEGADRPAPRRHHAGVRPARPRPADAGAAGQAAGLLAGEHPRVPGPLRRRPEPRGAAPPASGEHAWAHPGTGAAARGPRPDAPRVAGGGTGGGAGAAGARRAALAGGSRRL